jgi:hypothetical protein
MSGSQRTYIPCLCLELSPTTVALLEEKFGHCPLCHGSAACTQEVAEKFAEAWRLFCQEEVLV